MTDRSLGTADSLSIGQCIRQHPVAFAVTALTAMAVGALIAWLVLAASGDEPPIRVKRGSMYFDIVNSPHKWKRDGDDLHWKFNNGTRGNPYTVRITPKNPASCSGNLNAVGDEITVTYKEADDATPPKRVTIKNDQHKTKLSSDVALVPENSGRRLRYHVDGQGYISQITVGLTKCDFTATEGLEDALVLDLDVP